MATATPDIVRAPRTDQRHETKTSPLWMVLLHDDDLHSYDYVIVMLVKLFEMTVKQAFGHACEVDADGCTVVACLPKDEAILKRDQIMSFGGDPWMRTTVSMKASVEPVEG